MGYGTAFENGYANNALHIDINDPYGYANIAFKINSDAVNIPADFAWGIREVLYISSTAVIVRLTGVKVNGATNIIWTNIYNNGNWTGCQEH